MNNKKYITILAIIIAIAAIYTIFIKKESFEVAYRADADAIVFNSNRDHHGDHGNNTNVDHHGDTGILDIYVTDRNGAEWTQLTKESGNNLGPQWSGDKSKIVFVSDRDGGNFELYTMDANGARQERLTNTPEEETWPSIAPNTRYALFARGPKNGNHDIWRLDLKTGEEKQMTDTPESDELESWYNPDMTKIVFTSDREKSGIYNCFTMESDGSNQTNITNSPLTEDHCIFNSAGDKISFARADAQSPDTDWDIWAMDSDGTNQYLVYGDDPSLNDCSPWSPSDDAIVFESTNDRAGGELFVHEFATKTTRNLTNSPDTIELHPDW